VFLGRRGSVVDLHARDGGTIRGVDDAGDVELTSGCAVEGEGF
jgi:hypothetical protein